jgi:hypothetical protein
MMLLEQRPVAEVVGTGLLLAVSICPGIIGDRLARVQRLRY